MALVGEAEEKMPALIRGGVSCENSVAMVEGPAVAWLLR